MVLSLLGMGRVGILKDKSKKSVGGRPIKQPPVTWRPDLTGHDRACSWQYAAGVNVDGSAKNNAQHKCARRVINRDIKERPVVCDSIKM
jgi:hypothetical protein